MLILSEMKDGAAVLTLNRPERLNVLDTELFVELRKALREALERGAACIVLHGAGRCFSAGHDMTVFDRLDQDEKLNAETVAELANSPVPVICAIHGYCYTGGLELAMGCDILIAEENAKLGDTHAKFGLVSGWGQTARLPRKIGYSKALMMLASCRVFSGVEAEKMGLVDICVGEGEALNAAERLAADIAKNSGESVRRMKLLLQAQRVEEAEDLAREWSFDAMRSEDSDERIQAFLNRK